MAVNRVRMTVKRDTDLMQECMTALLWEAEKLKTLYTGKSVEELDQKSVLEFTARMREIHSRLSLAFNPSEGRSKILERFFVQWNNMLFGVFYIASACQTTGSITSRQLEILSGAVDEIVLTLGKNPLVAKRAFPTGE
ncbi:MAG: hypothetical protein OEZ04_00030 [Nitrospinota bacterium]|nr:hypothetical protein [Nitrospinota bacterium]